MNLYNHRKNAFSKSLVQLNLIHSYFSVVYVHLEAAKIYYPNFQSWFYEKVVPDVIANKRNIIIETREMSIAGIAIIKNDGERKLSTLRITKKYQNKGIGLKLFKKTFECLETEKPFLTVSEEKLPEFEKIFKYFGFELTSIHHGLYRKGKKEFFFNETNRSILTK